MTPKTLASILTARYGLALSVSERITPAGTILDVRPGDLEPSSGFRIEVGLGWRSLHASFLPDAFAKPLISEMARSNAEQRQLFATFAQSLKNRTAAVQLNIDDTEYDPCKPITWPEWWNKILFGMKIVGVKVEHQGRYELANVVDPICGFVGMTLALLPLEIESDEEELAGEAEGQSNRVEVNRYERSLLNRAACIDIHGLNCAVCQMDFGSVYGDIGHGYIHVHHVNPLASMSTVYVLNPAKDLVPVCPNCHSMLHRRDPPFSVEELRVVIGKKGE